MRESERGGHMALIGMTTVLAVLAVASSIYWAASLAPADAAPALWPFVVAFVGATAIAAATSFTLARQRGRTSLAPLVFAAVAAVAASEVGATLLGGLW